MGGPTGGLEGNAFYRVVYGVVVEDLGWEPWLAYLIAAMVIILIVVNGALALGTLYTWFERRVLGRFQGRLGPNRTGPFGLLQPIADAIKLMFKEDIVPRGADRLVFSLAPVVMLVPTLLVLAVIPFGKGSFLADLNIGVLYIVAVGGITTIAVLMAGYASANKFATFGSMRAVAMVVSYEIPLVMALLGVTLLAASMSVVAIVEAQHLPYLLVAPLGAFVFLTAISAELNRNPFDVLEAESELVAGYLTEYSGMKYGVFMLAEFTNTIVAGAIFAVLFLQGWQGPGLSWLGSQVGFLSFLDTGAVRQIESHAWFLAKVGLFAFVATWVRATLPRLRIDQILALAWKVLFPLSMLNVLVLAVEVIVWPEPSAGELGIMAAINWAVAGAAIFAAARLVSLSTPARGLGPVAAVEAR
ncbi:MAG: NADH-quinone oxidoreductase subunit NuoH [Chloroflexi bacterium]|nr:NADH-quinone oxidoreductase subunit NuoH [Chloroflexota bacterium]